MDYNAIKQEAKALAHKAGKDWLDTYYHGQDAGMCGFAWVNIRPANKGNTKAGKEERKILRAMGFELGEVGRGRWLLKHWNKSPRSTWYDVTSAEEGKAKAEELTQ